MTDKMPLGVIELESGAMNIYAMNDFFLNFTFENEENWEAFRIMLNILLDAYRQTHPPTAITLIEGEIHIETQYKFYINADKKNKTRAQDFKVDEKEHNRIHYVEFQNKSTTKPPIQDRALEYFVLGLGKNADKMVNQIWLLASDAEAVLQKETFMNYVLKDEATNKLFPHSSGILFISLTKLSQQNDVAGELASFLLGKLTTPQHGEVNQVINAFTSSFEQFKNDKEVKNSMSMADKWRDEAREEGWEEGWEQGLEQGLEQGASRILSLIKSGLTPDEALVKILEEKKKPSPALAQSPA